MVRHGRPSRSCVAKARGANAAPIPDVIVLDDDQDDTLTEPSTIASKSKDDPPAEAPSRIASKSKNKDTVFKEPSKVASKSRSAKDDVSAAASKAAKPSVAASKSKSAKQDEDGLPATSKAQEFPTSAKPSDVPSKSDNANSPVSVLEDEGELTEAMVEVEKKLEEERKNEDEQLEEPVDGQPSSNGLLSKLDELLNKTKCYSEFLHERMDEMNEDNTAKKRGRKRKGTATSTQPAKKRQVNTSYEEEIIEEEQEEDEKHRNLQKEIAPLVTGGTLKSYQIKGVKWMIALYQNGVNGILADQMGLGKTVQTITFLAHLMSNGVKGPFLICAPLSTLANWINEIGRWCPTMQSLLYHGPKEQRAEKRRKHMPRNGTDLPVIVTSYEVLMADVSFLRHYKWTYVVVDEGHRLKNYDCKLFKELKKLRLENTLLLTGTPLQNNLHELWSLLNFILPDIFSSLAEFKAWFAFAERQNMNDQERDETRVEVVKKLHDILRPFLLRRMKSEVEKTLPKKKEIILYASMSKMQKDFHEQLIEKTLEEYLEKGGMPGLTKRKKLNNVCMQLRKNCNHPDILRQEFHQDYDWPPVEQLTEECGKLKLLLDRLLPQLKARGHRVLIFSQMTKLLDIIEYCLNERGIEPYRLDGNVKQDERQTQIQRFETGEGFVFLLSTRAGGLGINLTSADTAIIYDSDWNPQMDLQAMDRCHRIGQTKPVHVYRLATAHSVECRMQKVANSKLHLEKLVIDKGQFRQERENPKVTFDESDLLALLRDERTEEEELVQSAEISVENLSRLLNRSDMKTGSGVEEMPMKGPGWEVVVNKAGSQNLLSSVEGYRKVDTTATITVEEAS